MYLPLTISTGDRVRLEREDDERRVVIYFELLDVDRDEMEATAKHLDKDTSEEIKEECVDFSHIIQSFEKAGEIEVYRAED